MLCQKRKKLHTLGVMLFIVSFSMFLFSCTLHNPSLLFNRSLRIAAGRCACQRCIMAPEDDSWFSDKLNHSVHLLLTRTNSELSNETYRWWQVSKPFFVFDFLNLFSRFWCGCTTCSDIINPGSVQLMDAAAINQALTEGFEEDVGRKTTHHVMYPESALDLKSNSTALVLAPFKILDLEWIISALTNGNITGKTHNVNFDHLKEEEKHLYQITPQIIQYKITSVSLIIQQFSLCVCVLQVNVFGFGADQFGNWHHYWEENLLGQAFRQTGVHDGDYEYNITQVLSNKGKIRLFKGVNRPLTMEWAD
uniref:Uncharacterized protein n=1 Tax=Astyanax mexicanus TaxID=7994 RepID=A0A8B9HSR0_ASTMX